MSETDGRRVLIVSSFVPPRIGGVERYCAWLVDALVHAGFGVRVVAVDAPNNDSADVRLPVWLVGAAEWPLVVPGPRVLRTLAGEIRAADAVVIQNHAHPLCLYAALLAWLFRRRRATVVHTAQPSTGGSAAYRAVAWFYDRTATLITFAAARPVAFSSSVRDFVRRRFGFRSRAIAYPLGDLPRREATRSIVWIGRLSVEKDPELAVAAVELARERHGNDATLDMFGDGPRRGSLERLARTRPWLRLHGGVPAGVALAAQASARVVLSSSRQESLGIVLLESIALGVPVIASGIGDVAEHLGSELARFAIEPPRGDGAVWASDAAELIDLVFRTSADLDRQFAQRGAVLRQQYSDATALSSLLTVLHLDEDSPQT